jgi:hypothetical protein
MDKETKILEEKFGKAQPFKVPDGYFDSFVNDLMDKLPEDHARVIEMRPNKLRLYRPFAVAAASICVAIFSIGMYLHSSESAENKQMVEAHNTQSYSAIDEAVDYTMMDNLDMYAYVSEH